jgi:hypothetical protein
MKLLSKIKLVILTAILAISISACTFTGPVNATSNPVGSKVGVSKGSAVFGLYFDIDTSIRTAAKNGGITKISTVDYQVYNVLGFYMEFSCIVTGE